MSDKISCGGLMERADLSLIEVFGFDWQPGLACGMLGKFGSAQISLNYLSAGSDAEGLKNMAFCVATRVLAANGHLIDEINAEYSPRKVKVTAPVTILTLYGPHFLERHNLASDVFSALCVHGIDAHTVCSSVNSISVVVDGSDRTGAVDCLSQKFEWPE